MKEREGSCHELWFLEKEQRINEVIEICRNVKRLFARRQSASLAGGKCERKVRKETDGKRRRQHREE
jgi:hypothetical protein